MDAEFLISRKENFVNAVLMINYGKDYLQAKKEGLLMEDLSAERKGFEPSIQFPVYTLSRRAPSTTRTPLCTGQQMYCFTDKNL